MHTNHSKERAIERFGLNGTDKEIKRIESHIKNDFSFFVYKISNNATIHAVNYNNKIIYVIYNKSKGVGTFITRGMVMDYSGLRNRQIKDIDNYMLK